MIIIERELEGVKQAALSRFADKVRKLVRLDGEVNVLITSNGVMRDLNRRFRKKDKPTDVLSFPSIMKGLAGDIAISAEIAEQNGCELGHGLLAELKVLILHGMLHLGGLDHESDSGEMVKIERRLRLRLNLPESLIERNLPPAAREMRMTTVSKPKRHRAAARPKSSAASHARRRKR